MNTSESYSNIKNKSTSESYPGQNVLISYITKNMKISYCRFLKSYCDIIGTSVFSDNWDKLDHFWAAHFLHEGKDVHGLKNKVNSERLCYAKTLQMYWKGIINEHKKEKENLVPTAKKIIEIPHLIPVDNYSISAANDHSIPTNKDNIEDKNHSIPIKGYSISTKNHSKISYKNTKLNNFCYDILQKLDEQSNIHPFYKYEVTKEFENDIRLIFRNCYTYNDIGSEIYCLGEELESAFNKIWTEKIIFQVKQKENLKRIRDTSDADLSSELVTKQIQVLEQNKDKLVYRQVVNDALLIASAYENLVAVMDGTKLKGFGRFGYSDIFVLKGIGYNNVCLELKYISLVNLIKLIKNYKNKFNANDLENLDKIIEKENEMVLLKRSYSYWSKEYGETKQTTIGEVLDNGVNQLKSYMNVISNGKTINYSSSGIFDERIKITKSNPNKLKGFVILVVGFHHVLWRSVEEIISDYSYDKV
ncbi:unnamed protein product [Rhizophagus irregularis]|nr:unnamed protein product [Rhizophagus irregularis]